MVAKTIKGLLLGLSSSSRHSGGSTLAESVMLGHADNNDGGRSHQLRAFYGDSDFWPNSLDRIFPLIACLLKGKTIILYCWIMREICQIMIFGLEHTSFKEVVLRYSQTSEYDPTACQVWIVTHNLVLGQKKGLKNQMICGHWKSAVLVHHYQLVEDNVVIL